MAKDERIQLNFRLDRPTSDQVRNWMSMQGFQAGSESDAIRALLSAALASTPADGLISQARATAYRKVHTMVAQRMISALGEIRADLRQMLNDGNVSHGEIE